MTTEHLQKLSDALRTVGGSAAARDKVIALCKSIEQDLDAYEGSVRDDITGPIVDAMYNDTSRLRKTLADGTVFEFLYRTKIARDFLMSTPAAPDHVWEPQTTKLLVKLCERGGHAVVGGAYFGDQVILMARQLARAGGTCHAFEPNADQLGMLRNNAELNKVENIRSWRLGLWSDSTTQLRLEGHDSFAHAVHSTGPAGDDSFNTVTIDDYCAQQNLDKLGLIMLDIEGAELNVFKGAAKQLARPAGEAPNLVFEVHRHYVDWSRGLENAEIIQLLKGYGYHVYAVRDFNSNVDMQGRPVELVPVDNVYLEGPAHGFNMVAVKDPALLQGQGFAVVPGVSPKLLWHRDPALHHPAN
ncbi:MULTISPECIES: FkbM family methyltransferase [unclassified Cupriavidus]|uniref:FkbM family methyltransferase n=1 Tax=unclassified Cupriavidus TaxID=2640874 RepID=UPI001C005EFC|nr:MULTISPECIES: FkbM family methyltransferase [unclassified Cupriavidus]MCA3182047.1 FkbM family methyltransferase [Cupriavidus sp.]MCA3192485.1 FkbM family methyltransferase [Cupriavidus sp.]MCA3198903.1 FkbM family methyltransferase [Cupriavidus sp.]MCA3205265.1 FkbM family methyltransferase [Cupriavidus sp.]MCA3207301.1 FkbM family methyltransferase [Cupriavidus sp.]